MVYGDRCAAAGAAVGCAVRCGVFLMLILLCVRGEGARRGGAPARAETGGGSLEATGESHGEKHQSNLTVPYTYPTVVRTR